MASDITTALCNEWEAARGASWRAAEARSLFDELLPRAPTVAEGVSPDGDVMAELLFTPQLSVVSCATPCSPLNIGILSYSAGLCGCPGH